MLIKKDRPRKISVFPASMSISRWKRTWRTLGFSPYWIRADDKDAGQTYNEALEFLPKNPGGEVYAEAGGYNIATQITTAGQNANIQGAGMGNTVFTLNAAAQAYILALAHDRCTLRDLTLNGNGGSYVLNNYVLFINGEYALVERVEVKNWRWAAQGIAIAHPNATIAKCIVDAAVAGETNGQNGIWTNGDADILMIIGNRFLNCHWSGVFITIADQLFVEYNFFSGNHIQTVPTGGGQLAISGNGETNQKATIVGNVVMAGGGTATSGMEIDGGGMTIEHNIVRHQGNHGIVLQRQDNNVLTGNIISNCGQDNGPNAGIFVAVHVDEVSGFTIVSNKCFDDQGTKTMDYGIWIDDPNSDNFLVVGNNCCVVKTDGIRNDAGVGATKIVANNLECPDP